MMYKFGFDEVACSIGQTSDLYGLPFANGSEIAAQAVLRRRCEASLYPRTPQMICLSHVLDQLKWSAI